VLISIPSVVFQHFSKTEKQAGRLDDRHGPSPILHDTAPSLFTPVVLKVVDIEPQGSIGPSKGSINSHGVEWGSLNGP